LVRAGNVALVRAGNVAAPRAGLPAARLDELLEAFHVALDAGRDDVQPVAGLLREPLGLVVHLERDPGGVRADPVEGDDAGLVRPLQRAPGDPLVGMLLGDLGVELPLDSGDLGDPVGAGVRDLTDGLHALHELGEALELGPLVVRDPDRNVDVYGVLDRTHGDCCCPRTGRVNAGATTSKARSRAGPAGCTDIRGRNRTTQSRRGRPPAGPRSRCR